MTRKTVKAATVVAMIIPRMLKRGRRMRIVASS
jgi:hypothetical protein